MFAWVQQIAALPAVCIVLPAVGVAGLAALLAIVADAVITAIVRRRGESRTVAQRVRPVAYVGAMMLALLLAPAAMLRFADMEITGWDYSDVTYWVETYPAVRAEYRAAYADHRITHREYEGLRAAKDRAARASELAERERLAQ